MELSIDQITGILEAKAIGDLEKIVYGVSSFQEAGPGEITFASDLKFLNRLAQTQAGAVIVPESFKPAADFSKDRVLLLCSNPKIDFFKLVHLFHPEKPTVPGIHSRATIGAHTQIGKLPAISPGVFIGDNVCIGNNVCLMPNVYIGDDVIVGDNVTIKPNVSIMEKTKIGSNVLIHSGTVIGSDGFGFAPSSDRHEKLIHAGFVQISDDVEIGANTTIDRGTLGKTTIGTGVKIDNQVHIAHNVNIGDHTLIVAQVGIAGSTTVGSNAILAGKAGISGHLNIGANAIVGPYCGVHSNVKESEIVSGIPQIPHVLWRKVVSILPRLPEMRKHLFSVDKRLKKIENKNE